MIWVIGGTKDSRDFIESFPFKEKLIVTTATEYGGKLLEGFKELKVFCKRMDQKEMVEFIKEMKIEKIVDLSHPYAIEVSRNAIECSETLELEYIRFERENLFHENGILEFKEVNSLVKYIEELDGNIFVTLGSNNIEKFKGLKNLQKIYFRILPKWDMIKKVEDIGVLPKNIVAMQGPFSKELNIAMMRQLDIKYMISKKGGNTGGEKEKLDATLEVGAKSILLSRPEIEYPLEFSNLLELLKYMK